MTEPADLLNDLVEARLRHKPLLAPDTKRADVERVVGPTDDGPDSPGYFAGRWMSMREYPGCPLAPHGLSAFFEGDDLVGFLVNEPAIAPSEVQSLGAPTNTMPSIIHLHERRWWSQDGLVLHVDIHTGDIARVEVLTTEEDISEELPDAVSTEAPNPREPEMRREPLPEIRREALD